MSNQCPFQLKFNSMYNKEMYTYTITIKANETEFNIIWEILKRLEKEYNKNLEYLKTN